MNFRDAIEAADARTIDLCVQRIDARLEAEGIPDQDRFRISVCLAEAMNNILEHGYRATGTGPVDIGCRSDGKCVEFELSDRAPPMAALPDPKCPPAAEEDGRGWFIILQWADRVELEGSGSGNRLLLGFELGRD